MIEHPIKECRQFYPKICEWSRAMSGIARTVANLTVAPLSEIKRYSEACHALEHARHRADFAVALCCGHGALSPFQ